MGQIEMQRRLWVWLQGQRLKVKNAGSATQADSTSINNSPRRYSGTNSLAYTQKSVSHGLRGAARYKDDVPWFYKQIRLFTHQHLLEIESEAVRGELLL